MFPNRGQGSETRPAEKEADKKEEGQDEEAEEEEAKYPEAKDDTQKGTETVEELNRVPHPVRNHSP